MLRILEYWPQNLDLVMQPTSDLLRVHSERGLEQVIRGGSWPVVVVRMASADEPIGRGVQFAVLVAWNGSCIYCYVTHVKEEENLHSLSFPHSWCTSGELEVLSDRGALKLQSGGTVCISAKTSTFPTALPARVAGIGTIISVSLSEKGE